MKYADIANINVNKHTERKANLTYLSWAWAVDQLMRLDENATWEYKEPVRWGETVMLFCTVTAFGRSRTAQLPVMDHRNKPIPNPDAFQVNTAMQRCLAKAIALHGLGLYIYAGEDLPMTDEPEPEPEPEPVKGKANPAPEIKGVRKQVLTKLAASIIDCVANNDDWGAYGLYQEVVTNEEKNFIWPMIPSDCRSAIKRCKDAEEELAKRGETITLEKEEV